MSVFTSFPSGQLEKQYIGGAIPAGPPPAPIKGYESIHGELDPLTGLANATPMWSVPSYADVIIRNHRVLDIAKRVTKMHLSLSASEQSQLTIEVEDPDFRLLGSRLFHGQPAVSFQGLRLEIAGVATIARGRGALSLACRSAKVQALKRRRGPLTVLGDDRSFMAYECQKVGLPFVANEGDFGPFSAGRVSRDWQPYQQVTIDSADEIPSSWTTFKRLAQQRGWMLFEASNVLYYAPPSWLFENASIVRVRYAGNRKQLATKAPKSHTTTYGVVLDSNGAQYWKSLVSTGDVDAGVIYVLEQPTFNHSSDRVETTVSFKVATGHEDHFFPGKVVDVSGVPGFAGLYLIQTVDYDLDGNDITVTAQTPVDPQPQQGGTLAGFTSISSNPANEQAEGGADLTGSGSDKLGLPVCGITVHSFLRGLRTVESGNNYKSKPASPGGASGAYQYIESTWQNLAPAAMVKANPQAYLATPAQQDSVAENEVLAAARAYDNDWGKMAAHHFYPATAGSPHLWRYRPFMEPGGNPPPGYDPQSNPRVIDYVRKVLRASGGVVCAGFSGRDTMLATDFVTLAVSQVGKPYRETTAIDYVHNHNPDVFDCSSLVQWSASGVGVIMPRNSGDQWVFCKSQAIPVAQALKIRGALLWIDDASRPGGQHVAISMGNGTDMAAHSVALGLSVLPTNAAAWDRAATIPGMTYPTPGTRRSDVGQTP